MEVYDIVLKVSSDDSENLRSVVTNKIRKNRQSPIHPYNDGNTRARKSIIFLLLQPL